MMAAFLLYLLATLDAALSGFRAAGGRNARIRKRGYHVRAQLRGVLWGHAGIALIVVSIVLISMLDADPAQLSADLVRACWRLHAVYLPYSLIFAAALALRIVPSVDVRSILNVLVFGPFTLIRPLVGLAGVAWAFAAVPRGQVLVIGVFGLATMLTMEPALNGWLGASRSRPFPLRRDDAGRDRR